MADLTVGKKAPLFTLPSDGGQDISLSDYKGGKVILYFYPKDNTSGCTLEAQAFRANLEEFKKRGYSVLGVSRDSVKKHCNFRDKYELNFPLLSDEKETVCNLYGVMKEKSNAKAASSAITSSVNFIAFGSSTSRALKACPGMLTLVLNLTAFLKSG